MKTFSNTVKNIFLTDDDSDDCHFFSDALSEIEQDTNLIITNDGVALMDILDISVPPTPHVIFLDLNMPKKNGFECLKEIRTTEKLKQIPIVVLSTTSNTEIIHKTYSYGANYYICKPLSFDILKKSISVVLGLDPHKLNTQPSIENYIINCN